MAQKAVFISTAIPYVNAAPHIGHAQEYVLADAIARYHRLVGRDVFFLSGSDDNALKNVQAAEAAGVDVKTFIAHHASTFEDLQKKLKVSTDYFIRTGSDPLHARGAQKLWSACKSEDIEKRNYQGLYCVGCEEFKTEQDLINGECPEHPGKKLELVEEENYFFRLDHYQEILRELIEKDEIKIVPESRKNEMLSFIKGGLEPFSISRSKERARGWGVPVPGDDSQIMYVWFDALANYITALGYAADDEKFHKYWEEGETLHVIGKGINRFHSIYWPAMLLSAGLRPPKEILVHGYITVDGQKMSKSVGNVIDPFALVEEYGAEATRYFLLRLSTFEDGDVSAPKLHDVYNADLANGIGNLASRILTLAEKHLEVIEPPAPAAFPVEYTHAFAGLNVSRAVEFVWGRISALDQRIQETEPYKLVSSDPERAKEILRELVNELYLIARYLYPLLPDVNEKLKAAIKANKKPVALFPRLPARTGKDT